MHQNHFNSPYRFGVRNHRDVPENVLSGPATSFIVETILYDPKTDLQGYTGILKSTKTIYVVFRGSSSKLNWMADFEVTKREYDTYPECDCKVHHGFYD